MSDVRNLVGTDSKVSIGNPIGKQRSAAGKCFDATSKRRTTRDGGYFLAGFCILCSLRL